MDAKAKVGTGGWAAALKAQLRLMAELEEKFKAGESVQLTPEQFAVMETYMEEDEALSTDLGMANLRLSEAHERLLTGPEALAGRLRASVKVNRANAASPPKLGGAEESSETYAFIADVKEDIAEELTTLTNSAKASNEESK